MKTRNIPSPCFGNPTFSKCSWINLNVCATGHNNYFTEGNGQGWKVWILEMCESILWARNILVTTPSFQRWWTRGWVLGHWSCWPFILLFSWTQDCSLEFWLIIPKFLHVFMTKCTVIFDFCEGRSPCKLTQPPPAPSNQHAIFSFRPHPATKHLHLDLCYKLCTHRI